MDNTTEQLAFAFSVVPLTLKVFPDMDIRQVLPTAPPRLKPVGNVVWETDTPVIVKLFGLLMVMVSVELAPAAIEVGAKAAEIVGGTSAFAGMIEPDSRSKANQITQLTYAHL
jgi:hypothetical protein